MPTPLQYKLPMTTDYNEFEDMVVDYFKEKYEFVQRYGRRGQKQEGIDIIIRYHNSSGLQSFIAVQCKNYPLKIRELGGVIDSAIAGISRLNLSFSKIVIAMAMLRDTKIQDYILQYQSPVLVQSLFWEEISSNIASNDKLLSHYYPRVDNNYITTKNLIDEFNEGIRECHIVDIMNNNPLLGMPRDYATDMSIFCIEMKKCLINAILLQKENVYQNIQMFTSLIDYYNTYLSQRMNPAGTDYYSIAPFVSHDEMKNAITGIKAQLNDVYKAINSGCSILYNKFEDTCLNCGK